MNRYILHTLCLLFVLCTCGCISSELSEGLDHNGEVTLTLKLGELSRADVSGGNRSTYAEDSGLIVLNENKIASLEIFLYPKGAEGANALFATRIEGIDAEQSVENITFTIPSATLKTLFADGVNSCGIYVIANLNTGRTTPLNGVYENTSITQLKSIEIEADFDATENIELGRIDSAYTGSVKSITPQQLFVMDSELETVTRSGKNLTGTVYISRAASKITFRTTIAKSLVIDGHTWVPLLDNLSFSFKNIVRKSYIDNGSDTDSDNIFAIPSGDIYRDVTGLQMSSIFTDFGAEVPKYEGDVEGVSEWQTIDHITPLYTYSSRWEDGASNEAYIMLTVPWKVLEDENPTLTYYNYFVPINMTDLKLVRNKHYRINRRVGVLGDLEELTESEFSYEVLDWVGQKIEVQLRKPSYLVVDRNTVKMNNIKEAFVGFQSSDAVSYKVVSTTIKAWVKENNVIVAGAVHPNYTVTLEDGGVKFFHDLDNTRSDTDTEYDFLKQTTVIRIYHTNNESIYQDITFVQYPAMWVDTFAGDKANKNYINVNGNTSWSNSYSIGSGCPDVNGSKVLWMGVGGKDPNSLNPNIYKISVSAFDATTANYIIADPRAAAEDITTFPAYDHGNNSKSPEYAVQKDQRNANTIKGYRGTSTEGSENLVSPEFIVASFLSTCSNADQYLFPEDSAYYRCASYQEAGYPAGRWRIPTAAELQVIGMLCAQNKLPSIFTNNQNYPSSTGNYKYINQNGNYSFNPTTDRATSVRCVYDTWYWRDKCNATSMKKLLWGADGNVEEMKANGTYDTYLELSE